MKPEYLANLWDELSVVVIIVDYWTGEILYVNRRVCEDLNLSYDEIYGHHYNEIFWHEFIPFFENLVKECADGKSHTDIFYWGRMNVWEQVSARLVKWHNDSVAVLMSIANATEQIIERYQYENIAYFDSVLGLPNGEKLEKDINELVDVEAVSFVYFEIDNFDVIPELYGWDVRDRLLRSIRDWLLESESRKAQTYYVNEGFVILGRNVTLDDAIERAEDIKCKFQKPWLFEVSGNVLSRYIRIRIGIVHGKYVKNEMRNLLLRTVRAPRHNIDREFLIYDDKTDKILREELELKETLINCVLSGMQGFAVHYQPIVDAKTGRWKGLEALCRWEHPDGGNVSPFKFIGLAEQLEIIDTLDNWVCRASIAFCKNIGLDEKDFFLDVNFSPTKRIDDVYISELLEVVTGHDYPANKLCLEITESAKMTFDESNIDGLNRLKEEGFSFSLDDFGTGYSSLENLIKISAGAIKIDKVFVDYLEEDNSRQYLLQKLIGIAHDFGMKVIVEGVESQGQYIMLKQFGADFMQGYLFSRPLPTDTLKKKLYMFS